MQNHFYLIENVEHLLNICLKKAGADAMITPREMLRDYMTVLNILMQNPSATFDSVVRRKIDLTAENVSNETVTAKSKAAEDILDVIEF